MLKRQHRLKKQADFLRVFREGKRQKFDSLIILSTPNNLEVSRFGVVVSKKVSKKAVVRNKIRRSLLALLEPYQLQDNSPHEDVVLSVTHIPADALESPYRHFLPVLKQWRAL